MSGIAAQGRLSLRGIERSYSMHAHTVRVFGKNYIATPQLGCAHGCDHHFIAVNHIGSHALPVRAELHGIPTTKQCSAKFEQPRISADLGLRHAHREPPPLRRE